MIRPLNNKDLKNFVYFCKKFDSNSDFYVSKDQKRLFLTDSKVAKKVFNDCLKNGEICFIKEEGDKILGVLLVWGFKDKHPRKYLKILANSQKDSDDILRFFQWQNIKETFIKCRKSNKYFVKFDEVTKQYKPVYQLRKAGFRIIAVREKEILLKKEKANGYQQQRIQRD